MIARELYLQKIRPFMDTNVVKVITGIRRCGKSVMMELIQNELRQKNIPENRILFLNFESRADPRVLNLDTLLSAVNEQFQKAGKKKIYLFFDEIQELNGWETLVNSLHTDIDADIYITGSNARLLSGELATYLAGRYVETRMYPFSFAEVLDLLAERKVDLSPAKAFQLFLLRGGFPFLYNYSFTDADTNRYLSDIFDSIILKDISQRNRIRDIAQLRSLILFFMANIGKTFSATSLIKYLQNQRRKISTETIYNYIEHCRAACLLHLVKRQDLSGKSILATQEKIYLVDHGMRQALYGHNQRDINQVLENIIYMELIRRGYEVTIGKVKNKEVDFYAAKEQEKRYIQVTYLLASEETIQREFGVLEEIQDNYPKYVLSMDDLDLSRNGIIHQNIRDFLMESCGGSHG